MELRIVSWGKLKIEGGGRVGVRDGHIPHFSFTNKRLGALVSILMVSKIFYIYDWLMKLSNLKIET